MKNAKIPPVVAIKLINRMLQDASLNPQLCEHFLARSEVDKIAFGVQFDMALDSISSINIGSNKIFETLSSSKDGVKFSLTDLAKQNIVKVSDFRPVNISPTIVESQQIQDESDAEYANLPAVIADDNYTGIVSFRAEALIDVKRLTKILKNEAAGLWTLQEEDCLNGDGYEMKITSPLTIRRLCSVMDTVVDGHTMVDTLRALPLSENSLIRRYGEPIRCWTDNDIELNEDAPGIRMPKP